MTEELKTIIENVESYYRTLPKPQSGEESLKMACSMYDTAKALVRANILQNNPNISSSDLKKEIFLRFYGSDFSELEKEKIIQALFS